VVNKHAILGVRESTCDSWEGASCTKNYSVGRHVMLWTARANFLWRDSEQWALLKHVAQYFCVATGLPLHTQWFMQDGARPHTAKCYFELSAWHLRLAYHLNPVYWSCRMWSELAPE
jgi:hypothetical protein